MVSNCRKAYWHMAKNGHVQRAISIEKLAQRGYKSILELYERALMRLNRRLPNDMYGFGEKPARELASYSI